MGSSGVKQQDLANSGQAQAASTMYGGQAGGLYSSLAPALTAEATNPQGYGPTALAKMNTDSQQSLGGSNAGVTGQAGLEAARTRNAGGATAALDASSQSAQRQNSENAIGTDLQDANLKQKQQQEGLSGLNSLYGTNVNAEKGEQGISNQALNNAGQIQNPWMSLLQQGIKSGGEVASAGFGNGGAWS
jgi:hypothetical protein